VGNKTTFSGLAANLARLAGVVGAIWLSTHPFPVGASEQPLVQEILDRWAEAMGGRDRLSAVETIHTVSAVSMAGLEGTLEEWFTAGGHHRLDLDLAGILTLTTVTTPERSWHVDQNGTVLEQAGKDLEDEITEVFLGTWSHLLPNRMTGRVELCDPDPEMGALCVRILPDGGTECVVWIDPHNHLPMRSESPAGSGETTVVRVLGWRDTEGIAVPARIEQTTGTDGGMIELQDITLNQTPPPGTFDKPEEKDDDVWFSTARAAMDIPLDMDGVHLFLQARVNDSDPLWFILDTGADMSCIDRDVATDLGIELTGQLTGDGVGEGTVAVSLVQNVSFRVPGVELGNQTVAAVGLRDILEARIGRELDGILGYDFISRFVVEIDYWESKLHLYDRNAWEYEGDGTEVPIRIVSSDPVCDATVLLPDGRAIDCNLYIDTGSRVAVRLNKPFAEEHALLTALPETIESSGGFGIGGATRDILGRITALRVGGLEFKAPVCAFSQDERGVGADVSLAGKLGGRILERCTVILDYERGRILLEPNPRFGAPFQGDMCGLTLVTGGRGDWHTFTVGNVVAGSPADSAGISTGDVIVSVDGKPTAELRLRELKDLFLDEGRSIRLALERDGTAFFRELLMKPML
jgi:hypothetical protein